MSALMDIWHSTLGLFTSGDMISIAIIVVIALAAGFFMESVGSLVTTTFLALVVFGIATYVRAMVMNKGDAGALAQTDWSHLLKLTVHDVLPYVIVFAVLITLVNVARSAIGR